MQVIIEEKEYNELKINSDALKEIKERKLIAIVSEYFYMGLRRPSLEIFNESETQKILTDQIDILKQAMEYDRFILEVEVKNLLPLDELDTPEELKQGKEMVKKYTEIQKKKIA